MRLRAGFPFGRDRMYVVLTAFIWSKSFDIISDLDNLQQRIRLMMLPRNRMGIEPILSRCNLAQGVGLEPTS